MAQQSTTKISDEVVDFVLEALAKRHHLDGQDYASTREALEIVWPSPLFTSEEIDSILADQAFAARSRMSQRLSLVQRSIRTKLEATRNAKD
jgi:hypothetical protein